MYFQYDSNGTPLGFIWNGTQYLYLTNQMGDVISITDANGKIVGNYEYDAWGKIGSITTTNNTDEENTLANINPLRYRGYYYDNETGYYYLQSRYYDANLCRFINADDYNYLDKDIVDGLNLFAYCNNDSVNSIDLTGFYRTDLAKAYAEKWWKGRNTKQYKTNKYDCANFVSQCLYAGKLSIMTSTWYHKSKNGRLQISNAWGRAQNLYSWLYSNNYVRRTYIATSKAEIDKAGSFLYNYRDGTHCTAVVFFDWTNDGKIDHATISGQIIRGGSKNNSYDIYYYAHSSERSGVRMEYIDANGKKFRASIKDAFNSYKKMKVYILLLT